MGPETRGFITSMYLLEVTIGVAVGVSVGSGWHFWLCGARALAEEPLINLVLVGVICMGADARSGALTGVGLDLVAVPVGVAGCVAPAGGFAEKPFVDFSLVAVVVGSDPGGALTVPLLHLVAVGIVGGLGGLGPLYAGAEELLVDFVFIGVVVGADAGLFFSAPLFGAVSLLVDSCACVASAWLTVNYNR